MEYLEYAGVRIPYQIVRSARKTVSIRVSHDGVVIRAPKGLSNKKITELVQTKARWIYIKYQELLSTAPLPKKREYADGTCMLYRGNELKLKRLDGNAYGLKENEGKVWLEDNEICIALCDWSHGAVQNLLEQWYRYEAKVRIEERVGYYTRHYDFGKKVNRIFIKDQKSRWGSCSSKCNLNFNYRLIMAPDEVLDYVIVHELCHLVHMNHSDQFWRAVENVCPAYKVYIDWLRKNGRYLVI